MKFSVFGHIVEVSKVEPGWQAYYVGNEGKKMPAADIVIPPDLGEDELIGYISDLCHEWARPGNDEVTRLE